MEDVLHPYFKPNYTPLTLLYQIQVKERRRVIQRKVLMKAMPVIMMMQTAIIIMMVTKVAMQG